jgi:hypothetical protein
MIRPETGDTMLGGLVALVALIGGCALLTVLPHRRVLVTAASAGPAVLVGAGLVLAAVAATQRPPAAGLAILYGPNLVLVALLAVFGAPSPLVLGGPLAARLSEHTGSPPGTGPGALVLVLFVLVTAGLLATAPPGGDGSRLRRAGLRALIAGTVLAAVLAALSQAAGGELELGVQVLVFNVDVLAVTLAPAMGWAALAGAAGGGLAGFVGSLLADIRWQGRVVALAANGRG